MDETPSTSRYLVVLLLLCFIAIGCALCFYPLRESPSSAETTNRASALESLQETPATILAFGDLMLDRGVRTAIAKHGQEYPFAPIEDFLHGNDVVVANAEGPFTHFQSEATPTHLVFTFDPAMLPTLKQLGFTVFSQANNHALNFGMAGLRESQNAIRGENIGTFGDPLNQDPGPHYAVVHGITLAFVGYHQFMGTSTEVFRAITEAKSNGAFVVVYPHWGVEYNQSFTTLQQEKAHAFIDAGADVILGAHPHVIEPIEIYKGKAIFYSMGNFIFDQSNTGPTSEGLSVRLAVTQNSVSYLLFPIKIYNEQASLMSFEARNVLLQGLALKAVLPSDQTTLRSAIAAGFFTLGR